MGEVPIQICVILFCAFCAFAYHGDKFRFRYTEIDFFMKVFAVRLNKV